METIEKRFNRIVTFKEAFSVYKNIIEKTAKQKEIENVEKTHNEDLIYKCFDEILEGGQVLDIFLT